MVRHDHAALQVAIVSVEHEIHEAVREFRAQGDRNAFSIHALLMFKKDFHAFNGHFPGNPILPGIIQLASVRLLAQRFLGHELIPAGLSNIKFRGMIRPCQTVAVNMSGEISNSGWEVCFEINGSDGSVSSGELLVAVASTHAGEQ